jgi:hypothetical protein
MVSQHRVVDCGSLDGRAGGFKAVLVQNSAPAMIQGIAPSVLELIVLGSGWPAATGRAAASYAILLDGKPRILMDDGPGTFCAGG